VNTALFAGCGWAAVIQMPSAVAHVDASRSEAFNPRMIDSLGGSRMADRIAAETSLAGS
jgi:hypothetical protein